MVLVDFKGSGFGYLCVIFIVEWGRFFVFLVVVGGLFRLDFILWLVGIWLVEWSVCIGLVVSGLLFFLVVEINFWLRGDGLLDFFWNVSCLFFFVFLLVIGICLEVLFGLLVLSRFIFVGVLVIDVLVEFVVVLILFELDVVVVLFCEGIVIFFVEKLLVICLSLLFI